MNSPFCSIFLDNSNFYKSTQHCFGKGKKFRTRNLNIDYKILKTICKQEREIKWALNAYGQMNDMIKQRLENEGFTPKIGKLNKNNQEKQVDTQLAVDATEVIVRYGRADGNSHGGTIIIISGDSDFVPVIKVAQKWGWNVEVYCYNRATHNDIRNNENTENPITIKYLDELVNEFAVRTPYKLSGDEVKIVITICNGSRWWNETITEAVKMRIKEEFQTVAGKALDLPIDIKDRETFPNHTIEMIITVRRQELDPYDIKEIQEKFKEIKEKINHAWASQGYQNPIKVELENFKLENFTGTDGKNGGLGNGDITYCHIFKQSNPDYPKKQYPEFKKNIDFVCQYCKQTNPGHPRNNCPEFGKNGYFCYICKKQNHPKGNCPEYKKPGVYRN